jgi:hypothetical protein
VEDSVRYTINTEIQSFAVAVRINTDGHPLPLQQSHRERAWYYKPITQFMLHRRITLGLMIMLNIPYLSYVVSNPTNPSLRYCTNWQLNSYLDIYQSNIFCVETSPMGSPISRSCLRIQQKAKFLRLRHSFMYSFLLYGVLSDILGSRVSVCVSLCLSLCAWLNAPQHGL